MMKVSALAAMLAVMAGSPALACDQQEAVDLMIKVSTGLGEKAAEAKTEEDSLRVTAANARMNEAGDALAKGDPETACDIYRAVAAEEGVPLQ
jgi:uncharacterized protein YggE